MYDRADLRKQLTRAEAKKLETYLDSRGILTCCTGWNLRDNGVPASVQAMLDPAQGDPMQVGYVWPEAANDALLDIGIDHAERALDKLLPEFWRDQLADARQLVLLDMAFNMGEHTLGEFHHFLAAVTAGDWDRAIAEMQDSAWWKEVGPHRTGPLVAMMQSGEIVA